MIAADAILGLIACPFDFFSSLCSKRICRDENKDISEIVLNKVKLTMDDGRQHENGRHKLDYFRGTPPWNLVPQHQVKEPNALVMNKKIMSIIAERDAAIRECNIALSEKNEALAVRDEALRQRDEALNQRDTALMERDNALAALQIRDHGASFPMGCSIQRKNKRLHHPSNHVANMTEAPYSAKELQITEAFPITAITSDTVKSQRGKQTKENKVVSSKPQRAPRKKVGEDLNRQAASDGIKYRTDWDVQDMGLNLVSFDESIMPAPICTCTGIPRQCYKWGNGGWQSSCCTINMSQYPLPQMPNKQHARMGGRKMSGSVFARLLSRLAAEGHDLSVSVDLKDHWARHGTNRYITIR